MKKQHSVILLGLLLNAICIQAQFYKEQYRPQLHFSSREKWINDPNGMFFYKGVYHLFYQHYPESSVWGPMHWGHAISTDLVHWQQQPIALYPDSLGYIFSGSAVVDNNNTSGFGKDGRAPVVAIFTHHDPQAKTKGTEAEHQSIAYSTDEGKTWTKYAANPVLKNPGIKNFRDPKVMWHNASKKWVMTLAADDRVSFYSSPDLKNWSKESEFGEHAGAHGGVWECPDLFTLRYKGKTVWVLVVNLNPGGPNKGSATQYFLGNFDGHAFTPLGSGTKWMDYGPDEYAGITWSNTGERKIMMGWMSNWLYANLVPTEVWRNAMTVPRDLSLQEVNNQLLVSSLPVPELRKLQRQPVVLQNQTIAATVNLASIIHKQVTIPATIEIAADDAKDFTITLSNDSEEQLIIGFNKKNNQYFIDRTKSGKTGFQKDFAAVATAPRFVNGKKMNMSIVLDESSVEIFADGGLTVMTAVYFPSSPYNKISLSAPGGMLLKKLAYAGLAGIWPE